MFVKQCRYPMFTLLVTALLFIILASPALGAIPAGSFQINDGAGFVNQQEVTLNFSNPGEVNPLTQMRIKNEEGAFSQWMPFRNAFTWQLSPGDGPKTVTIEMNFLIFESRSFSATVFLDSHPPIISDIMVRPVSGAAVEVNWRTSEPSFGVVRFNNNLQAFTRSLHIDRAWTPDNYTIEHRALLDNLQPNQQYSVKIEAVDRADNHNTSADFSLSPRPADQTPPTGTIRINGGSQFTGIPLVNLELTARDDGGPVTTMSFSNDGHEWSPEEPFAISRNYTLPGGNGWKTVYVRFRDQAGNYSQIYSSAITLDNRPLQISDIQIAPISKDTMEIRWRTDRPSFGTVLYNAGVHNYALRKNEDAKTRFNTEHRVKINRLKQNKTYFAKISAVDQAGNRTLSDEFNFSPRLFDKTPPTGAIRINGGAQAASSPQVNLELQAKDNSGKVASMSFSNDGGNWSAEEPFAKSRSYMLPGGDGPKTVYVRFRDQAGNYSRAYYDTITLDTRPVQITDVNVSQISGDTVEIGWRTDKPTFGIVLYNAAVRNYALQINEDNSRFQGNFDLVHQVRIGRLEPGVTYFAKIDTVDSSGNHSLSPEFTFITRPLDQTPPTGAIRINGGAGFTNDPHVMLQLAAHDNESEVISMSFSNDGRNWTPEEPFRTEKAYTLMGGEGERIVCVRYRDQAGNYSEVYSERIWMDTRPPQISNVNINQLAADTVEIRWRTDEPSFGLVQYNADIRNYSLRSNDNRGDFQGNYGTDHAMRIDRLQPGRIYYARIDAVDRAGNHGLSPEFSFSARPLDQTPPTGAIRINGGAGFTNDPHVMLQLAAHDNESEVISMSFSNDGRNWSPEEPFRTEKAYTLMGGEGERIVCVRYRDQAGNYSEVYSDRVWMDTRPPQISNVNINQLAADTVEIRWRTDEPSFGLVQYNADIRNYSLRSNDNRGDFQGNYGTDHVMRIGRLQPGRIYYARIDAIDRAGNHGLSPEFSFSARLIDQTPPTGTIRINGGAGVTNDPHVTLQLTVHDNESEVISMSFSNDGRNWSPEEPFRTEKAYTLFGGAGQRTVYVRYRDQAGNYSQPYYDTIQLMAAPPMDNRPPLISNVTINQLSPISVEIRWRTDEPSFGYVQYNADIRIFSLRTNDDRSNLQGNYGTDHVIRIDRLLPGKTYYGKIEAVDRAGNHSQSPEFSFNTPVGPQPTQPPIVTPPPQPKSINVALKSNGATTEISPKTSNADAPIDGDYRTFWQLQIKPKPDENIPMYWQVYFNKKYHLTKFKLTMENDSWFAFWFRRDGKWETMKIVKDFNNPSQLEFNVDLEAEAIRIGWPSGGQVKLYEVEIYN